jgi:hypothetical protein
MGTNLSLTLGGIIDQFVMKDIVKVNGIKIFIVKQMFKEGAFICFIFPNVNMSEQSVMGNEYP